MSEEKRSCSKCKVEKTIDNFYFRKPRNNYRTQCKPCMLEERRQHRQINKEKINTQESEYRQRNKERILAQESEYRQRNKERIREYYRNRHNNNTNARLAQNTRSRINTAIKGHSKSLRSMEILGLNIETYKKWIEYQMSSEMNWKNIHIDHVKAISLFDVSKEEDLLEAFYWVITQPLLKKDNLQKSNKFNEEDYINQFKEAREFKKVLVTETLVNTFLDETRLL